MSGDWSCTVYFSLALNQKNYWFNFESRRSFAQKRQKRSRGSWKNKVLRQSVLCKEWHHSWTLTAKSGWRLDSFQVRPPSSFPPSSRSVRLCLHSSNIVYKYRENGRQNKVSNFIFSKKISLLWSGLTYATKSLTWSRMANASLYSSSGSQEIPTINKIRSLLLKCKRENKTKSKTWELNF